MAASYPRGALRHLTSQPRDWWPLWPMEHIPALQTTNYLWMKTHLLYPQWNTEVPVTREHFSFSLCTGQSFFKWRTTSLSLSLLCSYFKWIIMIIMTIILYLLKIYLLPVSLSQVVLCWIWNRRGWMLLPDYLLMSGWVCLVCVMTNCVEVPFLLGLDPFLTRVSFWLVCFVWVRLGSQLWWLGLGSRECNMSECPHKYSETRLCVRTAGEW